MIALQMISSISYTLEGHQSGLQAYLKEFAGFSFLWQEDINSHYKNFLEKSPSLEVAHKIHPAFNPTTWSGAARHTVCDHIWSVSSAVYWREDSI